MSCRSLICGSPAIALLAAAIAASAGAGCTQVRGRKRIQEANELYRQGKYAEAVGRYEEAEALVPELPVLWLNKGYTCRQLIAPGGRDAESRQAARCALEAFHRLGQLAPGDRRASELTIQTWFDLEDYRTLEAIFLERARRAPDDVDPVRGLQDVYFKWGKWPEALAWAERAAALRPNDAEAQYAVGTFVWQILSAHGGGGELASYDPWPHPSADGGGGKPTPPPVPPARGSNDLAEAERVALADRGIAHLEKALAERPRYGEAMTYLGLVWRQKSFAFFADPIAWQGSVDAADEWQRQALLARAGKS